MVTVFLSIYRNAHSVTFYIFERQIHCLSPVPRFLWDPPLSTFCCPPPAFCSVTRQGVRGLIICTDPSLSPWGGCIGTVALNPIDMARGGKNGGGKQALAPASRPSSAGWWMSRTSRSLPPKPVESSYNELQSLVQKSPPARHNHYPPPLHSEPQGPPRNPRGPASLPPQTLEVYPWLLHATLLPPPPSPFKLLTEPLSPSNTHMQVQTTSWHRFPSMPLDYAPNCLQQVAGFFNPSWACHLTTVY